MKHIALFLVLILTGCEAVITDPDAEPEKSTAEQTADTSQEVEDLLPSEDQQWLDQSCSRSLGPSLWSSCMQREKAALEAGMPDVSQLSQDQQTWLDQSCSKSLGPSLYRSCMNREIAALPATDSLRTKTSHQPEKSTPENPNEKEWNCRALFGDEVVVTLKFNGNDGFVTMLDQEYKGSYETEGMTRIWAFGNSKNLKHYRYSIELNARGIAYLFDFSQTEKDGSVKSQETLSCRTKGVGD